MSEAHKYAEETRQGFKKKADHNKNESLFCFIAILVCSLTAPLFISFGGDCIWTAKITPSILSVFAAGLTSWIQLRKPQKLWSMYRGSQRVIEDEMTKHQFLVGDYKNAELAESLLAERVAEVAMKAHNEWTAVVPSPEAAFKSKEEKSE